MDSHTPPALTFEQRHSFLLHRLHSLSGIVPVGVFLIEHLLTNSLAAGWASKSPGPERFNEAVLDLHHLPYLWALELFGIFLPLAFHALYGIRIALTADVNVYSYPYMSNQRYTLQRATGYIAFIFILVHLLKFRFAHLVGWGPEFMDPSNHDKFGITWHGFHEWNPIGGFVVPVGLVMAFYVLGLAASVFHFSNGIWSFCIRWGITVGERAQKRMGYVAAAVGLVLFAWGGMSLYTFAKAKPKHEAASISAESASALAPGAD